MELKRTSAGLRELLFEQIEGVRKGTIPPNVAHTVATLAAGILKSVEVEMRFRQQQEELKGAQLSELSFAELPAPPPAEIPWSAPGTPRFVAGKNASAGK